MTAQSHNRCPKCGKERELSGHACGQDEPDAVARRFGLGRARKSADAPKKPSVDELIHFDDPNAPPPADATRRTVVTLTGEVMEVDAPTRPATPPPPAPESNRTQPVPAVIGHTTIAVEPTVPVMYVSFCKNCGYQNAEGAKECGKCGKPLEQVAIGTVRELAPVARQWGFDVLGVVWIGLAIAAVVCGMFLIKADPTHPAHQWTDYLWTGAVASVPGILVIFRAALCRLLFYAGTILSAVWWIAVGGFWISGHLYVTSNGQVGLLWVACLSALSLLSWIIVRTNDAFDL